MELAEGMTERGPCVLLFLDQAIRGERTTAPAPLRLVPALMPVPLPTLSGRCTSVKGPSPERPQWPRRAETSRSRGSSIASKPPGGPARHRDGLVDYTAPLG